MTQNPVALGNHVLLFRDADTCTVAGDIYSGGSITIGGATIGTAVGRNVRPSTAVGETKWVDIGAIEALDIDRQSDEKEVFAPSPGQLRRYDKIPVKQSMDFSFEAREMSNLVFELVWGSQKVTGSAFNFAPLSNTTGNITKKFWIQIQQYTHADALFMTALLYGYLDFDGPVSCKDDVVSTKLKFCALHSVLNSGTVQ